MFRKRSGISFKSRTWIFKSFFALNIVIGAVLIICAAFTEHQDATYKTTTVRSMDTWYFENGSEQILCDDDTDLAPYLKDGNRAFTIKSTVPSDVTDGDELAFRISDKNVLIRIDGREIAEFGYEDSHPLWRTSGRYYVFVPIHRTDAGKQIEITFDSVYDHERGRVPDFYIGSRWEIYQTLEMMYSVRYVLARLLVGIGMILIALYLAFWLVNHERDNKLLTLGLFMVFSCSWLLTEGKMMQFRIGNPYAIYAITFISLSMIPASFLSYVDLVQRKRFRKTFFAVEMISCVLTFVYLLFQILHIRDFQETLFLVHIALVMTVLTVAVTTLIAFFRYHDKDVRGLFFGLLILVPFALAEILKQYWNKDYKSTGTLFAFAIAAFLAIQVYDSVRGLLELQREKEEAVKESWDKSIFLANMSHEIRTPMNAIMSMSELLSESETLNDTEWDYVNTIYSASRNLLEIINDILDYSKFSAGKYDLVKASYDPHKMISDIEKMLAVKAKEKGLTMTVSTDSRIPKRMIGDEGRVRQIVLNLLNNAVKYTDEGFVDLKVGIRPLDDTHAELIFIVADSGIGIKEEDLRKLFDEFTQVDVRKNRSKEGTGLGLAIARQLAELMDGRITVSSEYGKGSTFAAFVTQEIDLTPVVKAEEKKTETEELSRFKAPAFRVLAVDDNRVNLKVISELLKQYGIEADLASGGRQAIEMVKEQEKGKYNLVFMDYMMPEVDGRESTMEIRKLPGCSEKELPIVALTADVLSGTKETLISCGMNDYLAKPVKLDELKRVMYKYVPLHMRQYLDDATSEQ
ncbi:MAG: response regulator [Lachnospiraceae bacterium]|nr:response regulator [Lachnospiraceae bacterium]